MKYNSTYLFLLVAMIIMSSTNLSAQSNPNPCSIPNVNCENTGGNGLITSFGTKKIIYTTPNRSRPFWLAYGDTVTNTIDTSADRTFSLSKFMGPGNMVGLSSAAPGRHPYFNNIEFTQIGDYKIEVFLAGLGSDTIEVKVIPESDFCSESPAGQCISSGGNELFAVPELKSVIPVDAVFPITVGLIDSVSKMLDTSFTGTIYIEKVTGPGIVYGTLSMSGKKWFYFDDVKFSTPGIYKIKCYEEFITKYKTTELIIEVVPANSTASFDIEQFKIFPNPFNDIVNLNLPKSKGDYTTTIIDMLGNVVLSKKYNHLKNNVLLETKNLRKGAYYLSINSTETFKTMGSMLIKN